MLRYYLLSLFFGLSAGSFANVCILRLPDGQSLWKPRSHCPRCGHELRNSHNIPVISYILLKGRCYDCKAPISWQYPLIEAVMAFIFVFHAWRFENGLAYLLVADVMTFFLLTISVIDYRHRIIPDELSLSLATIGVCTAWLNPFFTGNPWMRIGESLLCGLGGGALMWFMAWAGEKAFKKEALGGGDIKLIAGTAALLGWPGIMAPLLVGSFTGGLLAGILLLLKKKQLGESLPFGPFLSLGAYATCLFPGWLAFLILPK